MNQDPDIVFSREPARWPDPTSETRPWTRWWWLGSAVDKGELTRLLEEYHRVGLGGVEITPIYGVRGRDSHNIDYLSPEWLEMVSHTVREAARLGMQVDLPPGSGWKIGGTFLDETLAAARMALVGNGVTIAASGERIKRPGPGGGGRSFNPFDRRSLQAVIEHFTPAFGGLGIRAQFHDSWEYNCNARLDLLDVFEKHHGYDLREHVTDGSLPPRVRYDLQHLLAELALNEFVVPWTAWCHRLGQQSRNQAHGSPGNLLDLYAACDIPETEVFRHVTPDTPLISKFASSAAHVAGRRLVSSETGTWIGEHFHVTLANLKKLCDNLFVSGINHHVYHGTAYSPETAAWPGWLFYASTQLHPRNSIWRDVATLNEYVARCQAVLQSGEPDNDVLVYFPLHDVLRNPGHAIAGHLHIKGDWLFALPAMATLRRLWTRGYGFDYVSDRQIGELACRDGKLMAPGGAYKVLLVPPCDFMPAETALRLAELSRSGGQVVCLSPAPGDVPGLARLDADRARLKQAMASVNVTEAADCEQALAAAGVERESLVDCGGLAFIRRRHANGHLHFLVNEGGAAVDTYIPLTVDVANVALMDPMTGRTGAGEVRDGQVRVQMDPGASLVVMTGVDSDEAWGYRERQGAVVPVEGTWEVRFLDGGPELPEAYETDAPGSWAERGGAYERFAGTASYSITVDAPAWEGRWRLDLGCVHSSARVRLNGRDVATLIGPTFVADLGKLAPGPYRLELEVTSLAANRIRDLDRRGVEWRIFDDINFVNIEYKPFDASGWPIVSCGLIGPVRFIQV